MRGRGGLQDEEVRGDGRCNSCLWLIASECSDEEEVWRKEGPESWLTPALALFSEEEQCSREVPGISSSSA